MSSKYKIRDQQLPYFVTCTVMDWIDVFTRNEYRDLVVESLKHCQAEKGLEIYAWVIMTNHLHLIVGTNDNDIEDTIRDFKKYTSVHVCRAIESNPTESRREWMLRLFRQHAHESSKHVKHKFWQDDFHPIGLATNAMIDQRLDYIHNNPVRAGWVYKPEDYVYSSAAAYAGLPEKLIDVTIIE
jgi:hypothetical protein